VLDLVLLPEEYAVCRLEPAATLPVAPDAASNGVVSVTWTAEETSVICPADRAPAGALVNRPWRCLRVNGPVTLALTGILASLVNPLADARVNIFAFSTHDTDYLLVPAVRLTEALAALAAAGHRIETPPPRPGRP
jgi:uncharacterized protein